MKANKASSPTMMKYLSLPTFLFFVYLLSIGPAQASEVDRLRGVIDAALEVVYGECCVDYSAEQKQAKVRQAIEAEYSLDIIIRRAIGRNWRLMEAPEQKQVLELVKQLVVKAYVSGMEGKERPQVKFGELIEVSDKRVEIPSVITLEDKEFKVLYRLGKLRTGWEIYDIVAENISVVSNYRQQIDDHFRRGTGEELVAKLKELLKKEKIDEELQI